ncbi:hypothetical protein E2I00_011913, partial [Balaenoptera physalus]
ARALTPQTAETDAIRFLVGTQSLKYDNQGKRKPRDGTVQPGGEGKANQVTAQGAGAACYSFAALLQCKAQCRGGDLAVDKRVNVDMISIPLKIIQKSMAIARIHIIDFDDENNIINKNVLLHQAGEIWHISASPADKGVLATCYNKITSIQILALGGKEKGSTEICGKTDAFFQGVGAQLGKGRGKFSHDPGAEEERVEKKERKVKCQEDCRSRQRRVLGKLEQCKADRVAVMKYGCRIHPALPPLSPMRGGQEGMQKSLQRPQLFSWRQDPEGPGTRLRVRRRERLCLAARAGRSLSGQSVGAAGRGVTAAVGPETAWTTPEESQGFRLSFCLCLYSLVLLVEAPATSNAQDIVNGRQISLLVSGRTRLLELAPAHHPDSSNGHQLGSRACGGAHTSVAVPRATASRSQLALSPARQSAPLPGACAAAATVRAFLRRRAALVSRFRTASLHPEFHCQSHGLYSKTVELKISAKNQFLSSPAVCTEGVVLPPEKRPMGAEPRCKPHRAVRSPRLRSHPGTGERVSETVQTRSHFGRGRHIQAASMPLASAERVPGEGLPDALTISRCRPDGSVQERHTVPVPWGRGCADRQRRSAPTLTGDACYQHVRCLHGQRAGRSGSKVKIMETRTISQVVRREQSYRLQCFTDDARGTCTVTADLCFLGRRYLCSADGGKYHTGMPGRLRGSGIPGKQPSLGQKDGTGASPQEGRCSCVHGLRIRPAFVAWEPAGDGKRVISLADNHILLWDLQESSSQAVVFIKIYLADLSAAVGMAFRCPGVSCTRSSNYLCFLLPLKTSPNLQLASSASLEGKGQLKFTTGRQIYCIESAHGQLVRDLDFNPNKQYYLASCGDDCRVKFWDTRNVTEPVKTLEEHSHWVWSVRYNHSHDQLVLTGSSDGRVVLSNMANQEPPQDSVIATYEEHEDSVYAVDWSSADPWLFASLSYDGRLVINRVPRALKYHILL